MENLTALGNSFKSELAIFDELAKTYLDSDVELINQIAHHIVIFSFLSDLNENPLSRSSN